ncbi:MAG: type II toxin-antitoxin system HipA family toxin [Geobacter sp.]|nr:MAG: type II toxin-antitoxin system HipA family toxin [Geobacter sp.]
MIYKIRVWENSRAPARLAGELICEVDPRGRLRSAFRYDREFLETGYALDPVTLPLKDIPMEAPSGFFGVFEDSLPDDWGRRLLVRKHNIPRHEQNLPNLLLALGNTGMGALAFTTKNTPDAPMVEPSVMHLGELVAAAEKFERGEALDIELTRLFTAGSSAGGARPKALVYDLDRDLHQLAKFPSSKDDVDVVRIEAATMELAAVAGLHCPCSYVVECGTKPVLLVDRFDLMPGGRKHMISLQTLLQAEGYYQLRYFDILSIVRKYSSNPLKDSELLYRQMTFNGLIGNTDDHLKNFWMIYEQSTGWRLSPAFDLLPDVARRVEHILFFDMGAFYPGREKLLALGRSWGIPHNQLVFDEVATAVAAWKGTFSYHGVTEKDALRFKEIDARLAL